MQIDEDDDDAAANKFVVVVDGQDSKHDSPMTTTFTATATAAAAAAAAVSSSSSSDVYRADLITVRPSAHGLGLFATGPIPAGTLLIRESPLLTLPETADLPDLFAAVTSLPADTAAASFWDLAAYARRHDETDWIPAMRATYNDENEGEDPGGFERRCDRVLRAWLIYETNRFTVRSPGGARDRMGVFPLAARLNHSCRPNVFHRHNHLLDKLTIYALRDIAVGEEVCTSYIDVVHPTRERRRILRHWGFRCGCALCRRCDDDDDDDDEGSEARRKRLEDLTRKMRRTEAGRAMRGWREWDYARALGLVEEMRTVMEEERLDESDTLGEVVGLGCEYAMGCGRWDQARDWGRVALEIEERCLGRESAEWMEARERLTAAEQGPSTEPAS